MLLSGYIQPIPDLSPVIPSMDEIPSVDPEISPYETNIISFYKTWDTFGAFSNFSPHPIHMPDENGDSFMWPSVEHYYQVCLLFFVAMCVCVRAPLSGLLWEGILDQNEHHFLYHGALSLFGLSINP